MKKIIKCPKCGEKATVDMSTVLTSMPPQYNVDCPKCGRIFMFCHEVRAMDGEYDYSNDIMWL